MYKIIGSDQKEYGPVSSDQIQQWIANGRVNAQTRAQMEGGEWKKLGDFPEFAAAFSSGVPPVAAPPPPIPARPVKTSGLAITSLILGILGILTCGITALIGLILGIVAMSQVRKSQGTLGGGGIALAGTIVSAVFLLFIPVNAAMLLPALAKAKQRAQSIQCVNNMKQLSIGARLYASNHEEHFPAATNWCDVLKEYVGDNSKVYKCPSANSMEDSDYAYNAQVAGLDVKSVNPQTVLFFDSKPDWNLSGGPEMLVSQPRHRTITVAFADGHVEQVSSSRISQLRWEP